MRITRISVHDLFGIFNHLIPLNAEDRVTIIHGPNGFGKTILLKMLAGLFSGRYSELRDIPFSEFRVTFDNDSAVWVEKSPEPVASQSSLLDVGDSADTVLRPTTEPAQVAALFFAAANEVTAKSFLLSELAEHTGIPRAKLLSAIDLVAPEVERIGPREWMYHPTGQILSLTELLERFGHLLPFDVLRQPDWWTEIRESINVRLVEADRLTTVRPSDRHARGSRRVPAVAEYSAELAETIQRKLAESAALSQSLDRTFPVRLVERLGRSQLSEEQLRSKLAELEQKRSRLEEVGLLDREGDMAFLPPRELSGSAKEVLEVYVQDIENKLSIFDEIANKIELFKQIITDRFSYKEIAISKQDGFSFATPDGLPLPLTALSSGEQHEIVLLYQLLFKAKPNSLILIDEPELSLHVAWQKQVLRDLQRIAQLASLDVLIATHSPQIIQDRWDLTIELTGPDVS
jgi:ABC-type transport system involved in cytochrome c biogenesis ATPase subunit